MVVAPENEPVWGGQTIASHRTHRMLSQSRMVDDYQAVNASNWDARAEAHMGPGGYDLDRLDDPAWLSSVVRFDQPYLGEVDGREGLHLQCHLGTDTISLARLGLRMTGLDLSSRSLAAT